MTTNENYWMQLLQILINAGCTYSLWSAYLLPMNLSIKKSNTVNSIVNEIHSILNFPSNSSRTKNREMLFTRRIGYNRLIYILFFYRLKWMVHSITNQKISYLPWDSNPALQGYQVAALLKFRANIGILHSPWIFFKSFFIQLPP